MADLLTDIKSITGLQAVSKQVFEQRAWSYTWRGRKFEVAQSGQVQTVAWKEVVFRLLSFNQGWKREIEALTGHANSAHEAKRLWQEIKVSRATFTCVEQLHTQSEADFQQKPPSFKKSVLAVVLWVRRLSNFMPSRDKRVELLKTYMTYNELRLKFHVHEKLDQMISNHNLISNNLESNQHKLRLLKLMQANLLAGITQSDEIKRKNPTRASEVSIKKARQEQALAALNSELETVEKLKVTLSAELDAVAEEIQSLAELRQQMEEEAPVTRKLEYNLTEDYSAVTGALKDYYTAIKQAEVDKNFHAIFGVPVDCSVKELDVAWRKVCFKVHPDKWTSHPEHAKDIFQALSRIKQHLIDSKPAAVKLQTYSKAASTKPGQVRLLAIESH